MNCPKCERQMIHSRRRGYFCLECARGTRKLSEADYQAIKKILADIEAEEKAGGPL